MKGSSRVARHDDVPWVGGERYWRAVGESRHRRKAHGDTMSDLITTIPRVRDSVVAILRVHPVTEGDSPTTKFNCSFGSAFCVSDERLLLTAHHVLGGGGPRDPADRFYAFTVPGNGGPAYHFPVTGFPLERPDLDLAVLEIGPCVTPGIELAGLPVSFDAIPDGTQVLTLGYPSPEIKSVNVAPDLTYLGGEFFLKSHANEGIVAAQYDAGPGRMYELNVGWHHGESGGPIVSLGGAEPVAAAVMLHYRNVQSPHGIVAGPHRGFALSTIEAELRELGVSPA